MLFFVRTVVAESKEISLQAKFLLLQEEAIYVLHGEARFEDHLRGDLPITVFEIDLSSKEDKVLSLSSDDDGDFEELVLDPELKWHLLGVPWLLQAVVFSQKALTLLRELSNT